jgi:Fic family protein
MLWNWELPEWPKFIFDPDSLADLEKQFLLAVGSASAFIKTIEESDYKRFIVEILSSEGEESSRIEGEVLDRESLQSSIKKHFGIAATLKRGAEKEVRMAKLLCNVFETFDEPLTHKMLWEWHEILFDGERLEKKGAYRSHLEPMQIVSHVYGDTRVFFEAPPSDRIFSEMETFILCFNSKTTGSLLSRAALLHVYFESIHPFEDGNGRIGRLLVEKFLSQGVGRPILIAVSKRLEKRKKEYYSALEACNRTLKIQKWIEFFSHVIVEAHDESMKLLYFLIEKAKMMHDLSGKINPRQTKALLRMFIEGPDGFKGGLSAEKYIAITKTTRATATRDLSDLVEKEALVKTGELRHTRYYLNLKKFK